MLKLAVPSCMRIGEQSFISSLAQKNNLEYIFMTGMFKKIILKSEFINLSLCFMYMCLYHFSYSKLFINDIIEKLVVFYKY